MNSTAGNIGVDVVGGIADYFSGGALTPELASLVAGQVGQAAQASQLRKQDDAAAAGIIAQGKLQKQGENDVAGVTAKIAGETPQAQSAAQLASFQKALAQSAPTSSSTEPSVPGSSKAYKAEQAKAGGDASQYVGAIAKSAATTEGTQLERVQEGQQLGSTASDLGLLSQKSGEQAYLTKLQIASQQANPWLSAISKGLAAYGTASSISGPGLGFGGNGVSGYTAADQSLDTATRASTDAFGANIAAQNNSWLAGSAGSAFGK